MGSWRRCSVVGTCGAADAFGGRGDGGGIVDATRSALRGGAGSPGTPSAEVSSSPVVDAASTAGSSPQVRSNEVSAAAVVASSPPAVGALPSAVPQSPKSKSAPPKSMGALPSSVAHESEAPARSGVSDVKKSKEPSTAQSVVSLGDDMVRVAECLCEASVRKLVLRVCCVKETT